MIRHDRRSNTFQRVSGIGDEVLREYKKISAWWRRFFNPGNSLTFPFQYADRNYDQFDLINTSRASNRIPWNGCEVASIGNSLTVEYFFASISLLDCLWDSMDFSVSSVCDISILWMNSVKAGPYCNKGHSQCQVAKNVTPESKFSIQSAF